MIRAPSSGSPSLRSSSISETLESPRIFRVCRASPEISRIGEPSGWLARLTSEQYGSPLSGISVASAPWRLRRNSERASAGASKSAASCIGQLQYPIAKCALFRLNRALDRAARSPCSGTRHTSAQLALLADRVRSLLIRHSTACRPSRTLSESRLMPTIALVDDDRNILTSVSIALEAEGYRIMTYTDGASALDGFRTSPPDLAILDIKMPRMDGMETLRRLRQKSDLPVIFLTSKDEEIDELFGLKMGADDFIRKPFSQRLLVERVKAVLRRAAPKDPTAAPKETDAKALDRGLLRMDPERHTCTWKNEPVTLTVTEFLILQALATRPGVVKSRNALMDAAYDDQVYVDDRTIDSHIKRLRKKFKVVDDDFEMIETLYGVGYRFKET